MHELAPGLMTTTFSPDVFERTSIVMSAHSSGARLSCSEGLPNMLRVDAGQRRSVSSRISFENAFVARSYEN
jgi:hypothetical protein